MNAQRVPVRIRYGWTPGRAIAWVPFPRTIILQRGIPITVTTVAHELEHVRQFEERGIFTYLAYWTAMILSGFNHAQNWLENAAREASKDPDMRVWAQEVLRRNNLTWR